MEEADEAGSLEQGVSYFVYLGIYILQYKIPRLKKL